MLEITTAAKRAEQGDKTADEGTPFKVDDRECKAYRPGDGQLAVLMATTGRHSSQEESIAGIINFFASVLDDDSHTYVVSRLLDRRDPFGIAEVEDIMRGLVKEWTGNPTNGSSDSASSQPSIGQSSTPPTPALT